MDLIELLMPPEGKTLEHKRDFSSPEGLLKTIVAFGNTAHGILAIEHRRWDPAGDRRPRNTGDRRATGMIADSVRPLLVPARSERWDAGRPPAESRTLLRETAYG